MCVYTREEREGARAERGIDRHRNSPSTQLKFWGIRYTYTHNMVWAIDLSSPHQPTDPPTKEAAAPRARLSLDWNSNPRPLMASVCVYTREERERETEKERERESERKRSQPTDQPRRQLLPVQGFLWIGIPIRDHS